MLSHDEVWSALRSSQTTRMAGDIDSSLWARTEDVATIYATTYKATRLAIERLERAGRARRHPSGHDVWQAMPR